VGSADPDWIVDNVILDSLLFLRLIPDSARLVLDLGAGAGIPGIPIAIVAREIRVVLVESRRRRASFLSAAIRELGLLGASVVNERAEALVGDHAGQFDAVVMRCAGPATEVLGIARRLVRPGGLVLMAGPPSPASGIEGEWVQVPAPHRRSTRWFLVVRV
jgi:16S rRNA (guanine527-N7)-methyltransferase